MLKVTRSHLQQYGVAGLSVALALMLMLALNSWLGMTQTPFLLFFGAVMLSAWYGGLRTGLLSTFLSALLSDYFFLPPIYALSLDLPNLIKVALFVLQGILFSLVCEALHKAKHQAEVRLQKLEGAEEQYRRIVETAGEGIWLFDAQLRTDYVNPQQAQMLGYRLEEMRSRSIFDFMDREAQLQAQQHIAQLKQGIPERFDFRFQRQDNSNLWAMVSTTPIFNSQGEFCGGLLMVSDVTERKRAKEAQQASEARFRRLFESNLVGVAFWNVEGFITDANDAYLRIVGYTREEFNALGRINWRSLTPPEYKHLDDQAIEEAFVTGASSIYEKEYIRQDGTRVPIALGVALMQDSVDAGIAFVLDITKRKQAEQERDLLLLTEQTARAESEATQKQISDILESITDGFIAFDRQWRFTYINLEGSRTLGRSPEQLVGKNVWEEFPELADTSFGQLYRHAVAEGIPLELEDYYPPFAAWFYVRAYPSQAGLTLYFLNVNERRQTQEILRQSEERLRLALNAGKAGVWDWDILNNQLTLSERVYEFFGLTPSTFGGKFEDFAVLAHPDDQERVFEAFRRAVEEKVLLQIEFRIVQPSGSVRWVFSEGRVFNNTSGQAVRLLGALIDTTERKAAEEERERLLVAEQEAREAAESANRMKDDFLATLSHELRSPLNAMLGWLKLLRTRKFDETTTARALETVERNAKAQAQLVEDLLDVSRIIQGKLRLNVRPVELVPVIEAALDTVRPAAEAKSIRLQPVLDPAAEQVSGDSDRLQQIIWNLLSNAIKFTPKGGRVQIRLQRINSHVEIAVTDTGKGISPEFLPHVFERFRQADSSITRSYGGLGLGLAIVRNLVDLHGGSVDVESPGEGQGATFIVKLPLIAVSRSVNESERVHPTVGGSLPFDGTPRLDNLRILVVDDEADARELLVQILTECGAVVVAVKSADEVITALDEQTSERYDILISDIGMPENDGYTLLRRVRRCEAACRQTSLPLSQGGRIPAVALTAYARTEDRKAALLAGFQAHVAKPVEPGELIAVIANLTGRTGLG